MRPKQEGHSSPAALGIRGAVFTLVAPIGLGLTIPMLLEHDPHPDTALWFAGWPLIIAGAVFYGSCLLRFLRAGGTPAIFFTQRLGAVIGREPEILVSAGLYRVTRNPMYVGVLLAIFGQAALYRSGATAMYGLDIFSSHRRAWRRAAPPRTVRRPVSGVLPPGSTMALVTGS